MKYKNLKPVFIAIVSAILSSSHLYPSAEDFPKGEIIGQVFCKADTTQSYAMFLPSLYAPDRKWPVLYCFDPVARGRVPVEQFKDAAEKYGYLLVGLNNSRNGSFEQSLAALDAVWKDTQERLSIDGKRIYATGFSGGSRVASLIATLCKGCIDGVIACGAGFSPGMPPSEDTPFVYFGTIGTDDFNYPEMKNLEEDLDKKRVVNRLEIFEGGHNWASKELCVKALGWMELQAMKRGKRETDESLMVSLLEEEVIDARGFEKNGKPYEAYLKYEAIAADYEGLKDVAEFEKEAERLKKTSEVRKALKEDRADLNRQLSIEREILGLTETLKNSSERVIALGQLRRRIADIRKDAEAKEDTGKRRVARRALGHLFAEFYESATIIHANDHALAAANLELAAEMRPNDSRVSYYLARAYSMNGDKKKALAALKKAVEDGFRNISAIENSKELDSIRDEDEYKKIIESMKAK